jgi:hypothetical protein
MSGGKLEEFAEDLKNKTPPAPPFRISAGKLDRNFRRCYPASIDGNQPPYKADVTESGWKLEPLIEFDVCENGRPTKYKFIAQLV